MKYIKTFESLNQPQIGDYVILKFSNSDPYWKNYINNQIGKLTNIEGNNPDYYTYIMKFFVSDDIYEKSFVTEDDKELIYVENNKKYIDMRLEDDYILYSSPNLEDVEIRLSAQKYNII